MLSMLVLMLLMLALTLSTLCLSPAMSSCVANDSIYRTRKNQDCRKVVDRWTVTMSTAVMTDAVGKRGLYASAGLS